MPALSRRQILALQRSTATINLWYGSVRSSKTHGSLWDFVRTMRDRKAGDIPSEGVVLIVGLSTNTVWRNLFQPLLTHSEFASVAPHIKYRRNAPSGTMFGLEFSVVGASNEASWLSIQGMTVAYCLGDEAVGWPESFWDMLISRLSLPHSRLLVTANPGTSSHYLKRRVVDSDDPDIHVEKFLLDENPTLSDAYINRLKRLYTGLWRRRMIDAEWVAAQGAVYELWDDDTMVVDEFPEIVETIAVGIDYGTNHPTAGHALSLCADGRLYITAEWAPNVTSLGQHRRLTDSQLADSLQLWLSELPHYPIAIYADPAAASFHQELRYRGVPTAKAKNAVVDGIRTVDSLLVSGKLKIHASCPQLIDEIPSYRWDDKASDRGEDKPIKEHDDYVDALRYAVFSSRHMWMRRIPHEVTKGSDHAAGGGYTSE